MIKFHIGGNNINIVSKSDYGMVDENVQVYQEGEDLSITFNAKIFDRCFKKYGLRRYRRHLRRPLEPSGLPSAQ